MVTVMPEPYPPFFGAQMERSGSLELAATMGIEWLRLDGGIPWSVVEPSPGDRLWGNLASVENQMILASEQGMHIIGTVANAPYWAQRVPGKACGPVKEEAFQALADFLYDAVQRYSQPPYNLLYWELWNEPDIPYSLVAGNSPFGCWGEPDDPAAGGVYYAEMLKVVYPAIKSANPQAQVLLGGLLLDCDPDNPPETSPGSGQLKDCEWVRFIEGVLAGGGGDYFDGISFHAYDYYYGSEGRYGNFNWHSGWGQNGLLPTTIAKVQYLRQVLQSYGYSEKYLINSENALLCGRTGQEAPCLSPEYRQTKAAYLAQSYVVAMEQSLRANLWYSWLGWRASGLVSAASQPTLALKVLSFLQDTFAGAAFLRKFETGGAITGYIFYKEGSEIWVLWSLTGETATVELPSLPDQAFLATGEAVSVTETTLTVNYMPLILIYAPDNRP